MVTLTRHVTERDIKLFAKASQDFNPVQCCACSDEDHGYFITTIDTTERVNSAGHEGIRMLCKEHAPRPIGVKPGEIQPGMAVKRLFVSPLDKREHMWVNVTEVNQNEVIGVLDSTPVLFPREELARGDTVTVAYAEIEDVRDHR